MLGAGLMNLNAESSDELLYSINTGEFTEKPSGYWIHKKDSLACSQLSGTAVGKLWPVVRM